MVRHEIASTGHEMKVNRHEIAHGHAERGMGNGAGARRLWTRLDERADQACVRGMLRTMGHVGGGGRQTSGALSSEICECSQQVPNIPIHVCNDVFHVAMMRFHVGKHKFHVDMMRFHVGNHKFHVAVLPLHVSNV